MFAFLVQAIESLHDKFSSFTLILSVVVNSWLSLRLRYKQFAFYKQLFLANRDEQFLSSFKRSESFFGTNHPQFTFRLLLRSTLNIFEDGLRKSSKPVEI